MKINEVLLGIKISGEEQLFKEWLFDYKSVANTDRELNNNILNYFKNLKAYSLLKKTELKIGSVKHTANSYDHIKLYVDNFDSKKPTDFNVEDLRNKLDELIHFKVIDFALFFDENEDKVKILSYNNYSFGNKLNYIDFQLKKSYKERTSQVVSYNQVEPIIDYSGIYCE